MIKDKEFELIKKLYIKVKYIYIHIFPQGDS